MPEEKKQRLKEYQKEYQKNYHDAKERDSKKKLLSIMHKTKKLSKKSQDSVIKTCHKKKKTRLKSTKEKVSRIGPIQKRSTKKEIYIFLISA